MKFGKIYQFLNKIKSWKSGQHSGVQKVQNYSPSIFLPHSILQIGYDLLTTQKQLPFIRQKIFFEDGGHLSLDWNKPVQNLVNPPIIFIMHGVTGGSQSNYIKVLVQKAIQQGYCCVCLNSRGINSEMTSPIPFFGFGFHQLETAIKRVELHYPNSPIFMIGTSFGGNYLTRYLIRHQRPSIKGFVGICFPFNVRHVIDNMNPYLQKYFIKSYLQRTVLNHSLMKFWEDIGLVDLKKLQKSKCLRQFHQIITTKLSGIEDVNEIFDHYFISEHQIQQFTYPSLIITSKDDPIVSFQSFPRQAILKNKLIKFLSTQKGGHLCWFEGIRPKRWYPKPVFQFIGQLRAKKTVL